MGCAAGFNGDVDDGFAQAHAVIGAVVYGLDNVGAFAGQNLRELQKRAGTVLQVDADAQQAAIFDQAALDDFGQQGDVDVAAAHQHHGAAMAQIGLRLHHGGESRCAGALGQSLLLLQQHEDGAGNLFVVHGHDLVHVALRPAAA